MNLIHRWYCRSDGWAKLVQQYMLPAILKDAELGDNVLEIGAGPGKTTEWLMQNVPKLTAVEIDPVLADRLRERLAGTNVTVVQADATDMPFSNSDFSGAVCFTMLHHVPTAELQDKLFAEVCRYGRGRDTPDPTARPVSAFGSITSRTSACRSRRRRWRRGW
ncbi:MAG TPA: class I SAM-dependent methyltransferase [Dehalococcoidia bacterium]|nr:class I SAM-dependent methyltransferase [Dehalococcoidia bacterium]